MNPYEEFLQKILGSARPPAPRDATMTPMPRQISGITPDIYQLFNALPQISKVLSAGPGYTIAQDPYGNVFRAEGTIPWRQNNPGNMKTGGGFAANHGAIGESSGFAVFPSQDVGMQALRTLLFQPDSKYRKKSVAETVFDFAPPEDKNDTKRYQDFVISLVGTNNPINKLNKEQREALLNAILRMEGFYRGGKISMEGKTWQNKPRRMP